jgi:hypothetical protein
MDLPRNAASVAAVPRPSDGTEAAGLSLPSSAESDKVESSSRCEILTRAENNPTKDADHRQSQKVRQSRSHFAFDRNAIISFKKINP